MSAYVVSDRQIRFILSSVLPPNIPEESDPVRWVARPGDLRMLSLETATDAGRILVSQNRRNILAMYGSRELWMDEADVEPRREAPFEFRPVPVSDDWAALKALNSYIYQSCDNEAEFYGSVAYRIIEAIRTRIWVRLQRASPEYQRAEWLIPADDEPTPDSR